MDSKYHEWDCWGIFDPEAGCYHAFRLYAERCHKDAEQHDKYSRLLYTTTQDLTTFGEPARDIINPSPESSIWTGCTIRRADGQYQLFYTERTTHPDYWAGQSIRSAVTSELAAAKWRREPMRLTPDSVDADSSRFLRRPGPHDRTVHAWRDPFVFGVDSQVYMLISAKSVRQAATNHPAACIALLQARDQSLLLWDLVHESLVSGYEELEVPQLYIDTNTGEAVLIASTWDKEDYAQSMKQGYDPFRNEPNTSVRSKGYLLAFRAPDIGAALQGQFGQPNIVLDPSALIYAGVVIPEFGGAVIGFKVGDGLHRLIRSVLPSLRHPQPTLKLVGQKDAEPNVAADGGDM
jgi:hypothetical protein